MCGGFHDEKENEEGGVEEKDLKSSLTGREILETRETRFEIELESSVKKINGLWNSRESRFVFREIISCKFCLSNCSPAINVF